MNGHTVLSSQMSTSILSSGVLSETTSVSGVKVLRLLTRKGMPGPAARVQSMLPTVEKAAAKRSNDYLDCPYAVFFEINKFNLNLAGDHCMSHECIEEDC